MTTLYAAKPAFQNLLRPTVAALAHAGVQANQVTLAAMLGSLAVGVAVLAAGAPGPAFLLVTVWLGIRMALNAADGMLAREFGQKSRLGAYLNELGDVVSDAALYAPFALLPGFGPLGIGLVIVLAVLTEFAGVLTQALGGERNYAGPMGKSDRALVFAALAAWAGFGGPLPGWLGLLVPVLAVLLAATVWNRVRTGLDDGPAVTQERTLPLAADLAVPGQAEPPEPREPRGLERYATVRPQEAGRFTTSDGVELAYRRWPALEPETRRGAVLLFHRGHEHSGRIAHLADELDLPDFDIYAWDARGHGHSPGERGFSPGFGRSVRDVQEFVDHLGDTQALRPEDIAVVAQSVGAALAAAWAHDYAPRIRALVLASPAFKVKLYVPFARPGLALLQKLRGDFFIQSYVKAKLLTHDPARVRSFEADPLVTRAISVNVLLGLYATSARIVEDARAITVPTQLLVSGADWVVHAGPQHRFFERLGGTVKERHVLPGFFHDTLGERDRAVAVEAIRAFITARFDEPATQIALLDADKAGYTRDEAEALASPLPPLSPRGLYWAAVRANMRLGGRLSEGIRLGHETGFDSGSTLDYVYRNEARGFSPLGRMIDRTYLDSPGWRGIRQRKVHVEELIRLAMQRLAEEARPVVILDIAAGHGRYVIDAATAGPRLPDAVVLRDYQAINVDAGRTLIAARGLTDIARFEEGDAFDGDDLAAVRPTPTLAIVSGLYELFPDNGPVLVSLKGLGRAVPPGGWLVYTCQPWHPQLELIARALTSHRQGQAWIMRRRTQAEMDQLVEAAGFEKVTQRIDEDGIFTVSLARRRA